MTSPSPADRVRRVVMFVRNEVTIDARVLREAGSLRDAGWQVTIVGFRAGKSDLPASEVHASISILRVPGPVVWQDRWRLVRYYPWRMRRHVLTILGTTFRTGPRGWPRGVGLIGAIIASSPFVVIRAGQYLLAGRRSRPVGEDDTLDWLVRWRWSIMGWGKIAAANAPPADVYHGHDLAGLPAALAAQVIHGGRVIYDSHEIFTEAAGVARRPGWARRLLGRAERRMASRADAVVTVNDEVADELRRRLGIARITVVRNCAPRPGDTEEDGEDLLRRAAGLSLGTPIALYHGAFLVDRGIEQLAEAILRPGLERVHAIFLGYGHARSILDRLAADDRFDGRIHVLDAVPPDVLVRWLRTADVGVMPIQPTTLNHRLSTPNKLFECLAAGVPVVASDFPAIRRIVRDDDLGPLGEVCDPRDPAAIAGAITSILGLPPTERAAIRERCLHAARTRWNWETESGALIDLYDQLRERPA